MIYYIAEKYEDVKDYIEKGNYYVGNHSIIPPGGTLFVKSVDYMPVGSIYSFEDKKDFKGLDQANTVIDLPLKTRDNKSISIEQSIRRNELLRIIKKSKLTVIKKYKDQDELYEDQGWEKPFKPIFFKVSEEDAYHVLEYMRIEYNKSKIVFCTGCIFDDKSSLKVEHLAGLKKTKEVLEKLKIKYSEHDENPAYFKDDQYLE